VRGRDGDEIEDVLEAEHIPASQPRRRSNSQSNQVNGAAVKSKFEVNDIDEEAVEEQEQPQQEAVEKTAPSSSSDDETRQ